jgi:hypothetical protein
VRRISLGSRETLESETGNGACGRVISSYVVIKRDFALFKDTKGWKPVLAADPSRTSKVEKTARGMKDDLCIKGLVELRRR